MTSVSDKVLYLDGASQPITLDFLEDTLIEAEDALAAALELAEGVYDQKYNDDRAMLNGPHILFKHALKCIDRLIPNAGQGD